MLLFQIERSGGGGRHSSPPSPIPSPASPIAPALRESLESLRAGFESYVQAFQVLQRQARSEANGRFETLHNSLNGKLRRVAMTNLESAAQLVEVSKGLGDPSRVELACRLRLHLLQRWQGSRSAQGNGKVEAHLQAYRDLHQYYFSMRAILSSEQRSRFEALLTESRAAISSLSLEHSSIAADVWQRGVAVYFHRIPDRELGPAESRRVFDASSLNTAVSNYQSYREALSNLRPNEVAEPRELISLMGQALEMEEAAQAEALWHRLHQDLSSRPELSRAEKLDLYTQAYVSLREHAVPWRGEVRRAAQAIGNEIRSDRRPLASLSAAQQIVHSQDLISLSHFYEALPAMDRHDLKQEREATVEACGQLATRIREQLGLREGVSADSISATRENLQLARALVSLDELLSRSPIERDHEQGSYISHAMKQAGREATRQVIAGESDMATGDLEGTGGRVSGESMSEAEKSRQRQAASRSAEERVRQIYVRDVRTLQHLISTAASDPNLMQEWQESTELYFGFVNRQRGSEASRLLNAQEMDSLAHLTPALERVIQSRAELAIATVTDQMVRQVRGGPQPQSVFRSHLESFTAQVREDVVASFRHQVSQNNGRELANLFRGERIQHWAQVSLRAHSLNGQAQIIRERSLETHSAEYAALSLQMRMAAANLFASQGLLQRVDESLAPLQALAQELSPGDELTWAHQYQRMAEVYERVGTPAAMGRAEAMLDGIVQLNLQSHSSTSNRLSEADRHELQNISEVVGAQKRLYHQDFEAALSRLEVYPANPYARELRATILRHRWAATSMVQANVFREILQTARSHRQEQSHLYSSIGEERSSVIHEEFIEAAMARVLRGESTSFFEATQLLIQDPRYQRDPVLRDLITGNEGIATQLQSYFVDCSRPDMKIDEVWERTRTFMNRSMSDGGYLEEFILYAEASGFLGGEIELDKMADYGSRLSARFDRDWSNRENWVERRWRQSGSYVLGALSYFGPQGQVLAWGLGAFGRAAFGSEAGRDSNATLTWLGGTSLADNEDERRALESDYSSASLGVMRLVNQSSAYRGEQWHQSMLEGLQDKELIHQLDQELRRQTFIVATTRSDQLFFFTTAAGQILGGIMEARALARVAALGRGVGTSNRIVRGWRSGLVDPLFQNLTQSFNRIDAVRSNADLRTFGIQNTEELGKTFISAGFSIWGGRLGERMNRGVMRFGLFSSITSTGNRRLNILPGVLWGVTRWFGADVLPEQLGDYIGNKVVGGAGTLFGRKRGSQTEQELTTVRSEFLLNALGEGFAEFHPHSKISHAISHHFQQPHEQQILLNTYRPLLLAVGQSEAEIDRLQAAGQIFSRSPDSENHPITRWMQVFAAYDAEGRNPEHLLEQLNPESLAALRQDIERYSPATDPVTPSNTQDTSDRLLLQLVQHSFLTDSSLQSVWTQWKNQTEAALSALRVDAPLRQLLRPTILQEMAQRYRPQDRALFIAEAPRLGEILRNLQGQGLGTNAKTGFWRQIVSNYLEAVREHSHSFWSDFVGIDGDFALSHEVVQERFQERGQRFLREVDLLFASTEWQEILRTDSAADSNSLASTLRQEVLERAWTTGQVAFNLSAYQKLYAQLYPTPSPVDSEENPYRHTLTSAPTRREFIVALLLVPAFLRMQIILGLQVGQFEVRSRLGRWSFVSTGEEQSDSQQSGGESFGFQSSTQEESQEENPQEEIEDPRINARGTLPNSDRAKKKIFPECAMLPIGWGSRFIDYRLVDEREKNIPGILLNQDGSQRINPVRVASVAQDGTVFIIGQDARVRRMQVAVGEIANIETGQTYLLAELPRGAGGSLSLQEKVFYALRAGLIRLQDRFAAYEEQNKAHPVVVALYSNLRRQISELQNQLLEMAAHNEVAVHRLEEEYAQLLFEEKILVSRFVVDGVMEDLAGRHYAVALRNMSVLFSTFTPWQIQHCLEGNNHVEGLPDLFVAIIHEGILCFVGMMPHLRTQIASLPADQREAFVDAFLTYSKTLTLYERFCEVVSHFPEELRQHWKINALPAAEDLRESLLLEVLSPTPNDMASLIEALGDTNPASAANFNAMNELIDRGAESVIALVAAIEGHENRLVRHYAEETLRSIRDLQALDLLLIALTRSNPTVRSSALEALSETEDTRAIDAFILALNDSDAEVRKSASVALMNLPDARAIDALIICLKDNVETIRTNAAWALQRIGAPAADSLLASLDDENVWVRRFSAKILGEMKEPRAAPALVALLRNDPQVQRRAARALVKIGPFSLDLLLGAVREVPSTRLHVQKVLDECSDREMKSSLAEALEEFSSLSTSALPEMPHSFDVALGNVAMSPLKAGIPGQVVRLEEGMQPSEEGFTPVRNDSLNFAFEKPKGGFWTASLNAAGASTWDQFLNEEDAPYEDDDGVLVVGELSKHEVAWKMIPRNDARICIIATAEDYRVLKEKYYSSDGYFDFEKMSDDYDGLHVTMAAIKLHGAFPFWEVESTVWFRWVFEKVEAHNTVSDAHANVVEISIEEMAPGIPTSVAIPLAGDERGFSNFSSMLAGALSLFGITQVSQLIQSVSAQLTFMAPVAHAIADFWDRISGVSSTNTQHSAIVSPSFMAAGLLIYALGSVMTVLTKVAPRKAPQPQIPAALKDRLLKLINHKIGSSIQDYRYVRLKVSDDPAHWQIFATLSEENLKALSPNEIIEIAKGLGVVGRPAAMKIIWALRDLRSTDPKVRAALVKAAAEIGGEEALKFIEMHLIEMNEKDDSVRVAMVLALERIGGERAFHLLSHFKRRGGRAYAIALGLMKDPNCYDEILAWLDRKDNYGVAIELARALSLTDPVRATRDLVKYPFAHFIYLSTVKNLESAKKLIQTIEMGENEGEETQIEAVKALAGNRCDASFEKISAILQSSEDRDLLREAAKVLETLERPQETSVLVSSKSLWNKIADLDTAKELARLLGRLKGREGLDFIESWCDEKYSRGTWTLEGLRSVSSAFIMGWAERGDPEFLEYFEQNPAQELSPEMLEKWVAHYCVENTPVVEAVPLTLQQKIAQEIATQVSRWRSRSRAIFSRIPAGGEPSKRLQPGRMPDDWRPLNDKDVVSGRIRWSGDRYFQSVSHPEEQGNGNVMVAMDARLVANKTWFGETIAVTLAQLAAADQREVGIMVGADQRAQGKLLAAGHRKKFYPPRKRIQAAELLEDMSRVGSEGRLSLMLADALLNQNLTRGSTLFLVGNFYVESDLPALERAIRQLARKGVRVVPILAGAQLSYHSITFQFNSGSPGSFWSVHQSYCQGRMAWRRRDILNGVQSFMQRMQGLVLDEKGTDSTALVNELLRECASNSVSRRQEFKFVFINTGRETYNAPVSLPPVGINQELDAAIRNNDEATFIKIVEEAKEKGFAEIMDWVNGLIQDLPTGELEFVEGRTHSQDFYEAGLRGEAPPPHSWGYTNKTLRAMLKVLRDKRLKAEALQAEAAAHRNSQVQLPPAIFPLGNSVPGISSSGAVHEGGFAFPILSFDEDLPESSCYLISGVYAHWNAAQGSWEANEDFTVEAFSEGGGRTVLATIEPCIASQKIPPPLGGKFLADVNSRVLFELCENSPDPDLMARPLEKFRQQVASIYGENVADLLEVFPIEELPQELQDLVKDVQKLSLEKAIQEIQVYVIRHYRYFFYDGFLKAQFERLIEKAKAGSLTGLQDYVHSILASGGGVCAELSTLTLVLLRAAGIPVLYGAGHVSKEKRVMSTGHVVSLIPLPAKEGGWHLMPVETSFPWVPPRVMEWVNAVDDPPSRDLSIRELAVLGLQGGFAIGTLVLGGWSLPAAIGTVVGARILADLGRELLQKNELHPNSEDEESANSSSDESSNFQQDSQGESKEEASTEKPGPAQKPDHAPAVSEVETPWQRLWNQADETQRQAISKVWEYYLYVLLYRNPKNKFQDIPISELMLTPEAFESFDAFKNEVHPPDYWIARMKQKGLQPTLAELQTLRRILEMSFPPAPQPVVEEIPPSPLQQVLGNRAVQGTIAAGALVLAGWSLPVVLGVAAGASLLAVAGKNFREKVEVQQDIQKQRNSAVEQLHQDDEGKVRFSSERIAHEVFMGGLIVSGLVMRDLPLPLAAGIYAGIRVGVGTISAAASWFQETRLFRELDDFSKLSPEKRNVEQARALIQKIINRGSDWLEASEDLGKGRAYSHIAAFASPPLSLLSDVEVIQALQDFADRIDVSPRLEFLSEGIDALDDVPMSIAAFQRILAALAEQLFSRPNLGLSDAVYLKLKSHRHYVLENHLSEWIGIIHAMQMQEETSELAFNLKARLIADGISEARIDEQLRRLAEVQSTEFHPSIVALPKRIRLSLGEDVIDEWKIVKADPQKEKKVHRVEVVNGEIFLQAGTVFHGVFTPSGQRVQRYVVEGENAELESGDYLVSDFTTRGGASLPGEPGYKGPDPEETPQKPSLLLTKDTTWEEIEAHGRASIEFEFQEILKVLETGSGADLIKALNKFASRHSRDVRALEILIQHFENPQQDAKVRAYVPVLLAQYKDPRIFTLLVRALANKDEKPEVRYELISALGLLSDRRALKILLSFLSSPDSKDKVEAISALGRLGDRRAKKFLIHCLNDRNPEVRSRAADNLGRINDLEDLDPLLQCFKDPDWMVPSSASDAFFGLEKFWLQKKFPEKQWVSNIYYSRLRSAVWDAVAEVRANFARPFKVYLDPITGKRVKSNHPGALHAHFAQRDGKIHLKNLAAVQEALGALKAAQARGYREGTDPHFKEKEEVLESLIALHEIPENLVAYRKERDVRENGIFNKMQEGLEEYLVESKKPGAILGSVITLGTFGYFFGGISIWIPLLALYLAGLLGSAKSPGNFQRAALFLRKLFSPQNNSEAEIEKLVEEAMAQLPKQNLALELVEAISPQQARTNVRVETPDEEAARLAKEAEEARLAQAKREAAEAGLPTGPVIPPMTNTGISGDLFLGMNNSVDDPHHHHEMSPVERRIRNQGLGNVRTAESGNEGGGGSDAGSPMRIDFQQTLQASYQKSLDALPASVPEHFREQARLAAYYFQALESDSPLLTREGKDMREKVDAFARQLANSGFVTAALRKNRKTNAGISFPAWVLSRVLPDQKLEDAEYESFRLWYNLYAQTQGARLEKQEYGDYYNFHQGTAHSKIFGRIGANNKIYIEGAAFRKFKSLENTLHELISLGLHPGTTKLSGSDRLVLYFGYLTDEQVTTIQRVFANHDIEIRGPGQDPSRVTGPRVSSYEAYHEMVSNSNDGSLGESRQNPHVWTSKIYSPQEFFKQWLRLTFTGNKNPADPYRLSFIEAHIPEFEDEKKFVAAVQKAAALPVLWLKKGMRIWDVFDHLKPSPIGSVTIDVATREPILAVNRSIILRVSYRPRGVRIIEGKPYRIECWMNGAWQPVQGDLKQPYHAHYRVVPKTAAVGDRNAPHFRFDLDPDGLILRGEELGSEGGGGRDAGSPMRIDFQQTLQPVYQKSLDALPESIPDYFRDQARVAAHYFQALENGTTLASQKGDDLNAQVENFADVVANTGFVTEGLKRNQDASYPRIVFPEWITKRVRPLQKISARNLARIVQWYKRYVASQHATLASHDNGDYYTFPEGTQHSRDFSQIGGKSKIYVEGESLVKMPTLERALRALAAANLHPESTKLTRKGRLVLYFGHLTADQMKRIQDVFADAALRIRGPAQDHARLTALDETFHEEAIHSNDSGLGEGRLNPHYWKATTYSPERFFRQWLQLTFYANKNPADPYRLSFVEAMLPEGPDAAAFQRSIDKASILPVLWLKKGEQVWDVFTHLLPSPIGTVHIDLEGKIPVLSIDGRLVLKVFESEAVAEVVPRIPYRVECWVEGAWQEVPYEFYAPFLPHYRIVMRDSVPGDPQVPHFRFDLDRDDGWITPAGDLLEERQESERETRTQETQRAAVMPPTSETGIKGDLFSSFDNAVDNPSHHHEMSPVERRIRNQGLGNVRTAESGNEGGGDSSALVPAVAPISPDESAEKNMGRMFMLALGVQVILERALVFMAHWSAIGDFASGSSAESVHKMYGGFGISATRKVPVLDPVGQNYRESSVQASKLDISLKQRKVAAKFAKTLAAGKSDMAGAAANMHFSIRRLIEDAIEEGERQAEKAEELAMLEEGRERSQSPIHMNDKMEVISFLQSHVGRALLERTIPADSKDTTGDLRVLLKVALRANSAAQARKIILECRELTRVADEGNALPVGIQKTFCRQALWERRISLDEYRTKVSSQTAALEIDPQMGLIRLSVPALHRGERGDLDTQVNYNALFRFFLHPYAEKDEDLEKTLREQSAYIRALGSIPLDHIIGNLLFLYELLNKHALLAPSEYAAFLSNLRRWVENFVITDEEDIYRLHQILEDVIRADIQEDHPAFADMSYLIRFYLVLSQKIAKRSGEFERWVLARFGKDSQIAFAHRFRAGHPEILEWTILLQQIIADPKFKASHPQATAALAYLNQLQPALRKVQDIAPPEPEALDVMGQAVREYASNPFRYKPELRKLDEVVRANPHALTAAHIRILSNALTDPQCIAIAPVLEAWTREGLLSASVDEEVYQWMRRVLGEQTSLKYWANRFRVKDKTLWDAMKFDIAVQIAPEAVHGRELREIISRYIIASNEDPQHRHLAFCALVAMHRSHVATEVKIILFDEWSNMREGEFRKILRTCVEVSRNFTKPASIAESYAPIFELMELLNPTNQAKIIEQFARHLIEDFPTEEGPNAKPGDRLVYEGLMHDLNQRMADFQDPATRILQRATELLAEGNLDGRTMLRIVPAVSSESYKERAEREAREAGVERNPVNSLTPRRRGRGDPEES